VSCPCLELQTQTGAGLGLAIVKKALQRLGGSLELANATGGGLIVHIRLKRV
jgi:two-component system, OmpR family, osmolarity sensor histidine kinase EnvZ